MNKPKRIRHQVCVTMTREAKAQGRRMATAAGLTFSGFITHQIIGFEDEQEKQRCERVKDAIQDNLRLHLYPTLPPLKRGRV